jgi:hypothetical protein
MDSPSYHIGTGSSRKLSELKQISQGVEYLFKKYDPLNLEERPLKKRRKEEDT